MSEASYRNGRGRSPSPSRSPDSRAGSYNREPGSVSRDQDRERELAEQLRKRAASGSLGRRSSEKRRQRSYTPSDRSRSASPPPRRARSPSAASGRSYDSRRGSQQSGWTGRDREVDESREERRRRRRGARDMDEEDEGADAQVRDAGERAYRRRYDDEPRRSGRDDDYDRDYDRRRDRDRRDRDYDRYDRHEPDSRRSSGRRDEDQRSSRRRSPSPAGPRFRPPPVAEADDYEDRSIFCSQLAARLVQRDLGEFFESHLGENTVKDVCIVMDKITKRSKGIGYVELASRDLVPKAIALSGQLLFGIPILVQPSDAVRNRADSGANELVFRPNLPGAVPIVNPALIGTGMPIHLGLGSFSASAPNAQTVNTAARLYVGSLHFKLTAEEVKAVFDPFGEVEYVDLHREPATGKSKGFAFVQFRNPPDAQKALAQMDGFVLAGRPIRVGNVNARGTGSAGGGGGGGGASATSSNTMALGSRNDGGHEPQALSSFDEGGGGRLDASARAALMQKLARVPVPEPTRSLDQQRPSTIPAATSRTLQLTNMFDPAEETERDWDKDLADDVKAECERQYGIVERIHVERESQGDIYVKFGDVQAASKAVQGLNGRFFGGKSIGATFISEAIFNAKVG
ncbi:Phosphatidylinositol-3-phosphatase SAC1 [Tilletia horrida]|uniref:Phosphatidylinositol-3-phosphatase SAC1 n=1 Tax=Tilletia horrida TaxID=155126 RepID=A0AAN6GH51_9BASI|nr:Phosphatidylinositol-3-phosphatase SAC1 [Tilletia horrida]